ncbi:hypothetical protein EI94DRAFT_1742514 [Lactarius quietus]|nr:hypothetical protein EI94DRAFT_1742514 [Lactarius quietus]
MAYFDLFRLDQEVALIYPAPWNVVKAAYLFCRYYPIAIAPFHLWGLVGDHEQHVCDSYYHALYVCAMPAILSSQFILMLRTYAFSGRKKTILALLLIAFFGLVGVMIWVISKKLSLTPVFIILNRSGCFAVSDPPNMSAIVASILDGSISSPGPIGFHMGLISILTTVFDCVNMFFVICYCVQRGTMGPLGQTFLKQGMLVYVFMTVLNGLTIGTYLSSYLVTHGFGSTSSFAYILPSVLSCRLVLMLRRKASPTQTELRLEHSQMINEALELVEVGLHSNKTADTSIPSVSLDAHAQP